MASINCGHCGDKHSTVSEVRVCAVPRPADAPRPAARHCDRCNGVIAPDEFYQNITANGGKPTRCMPCAQLVNGPDWKPSLYGFQICQGDYAVSAERFAKIFG